MSYFDDGRQAVRESNISSPIQYFTGGAQLLFIGQRAHNPAIKSPAGNNDIAARVYSSI
jgi:hypothetical protein